MSEFSKIDMIVEAALRLAARKPWRDVTLGEIAGGAQLSLAELSSHVASKSDILAAFIRNTDRRLLASLAEDPVEGNGHDRLFDVMLRRFELLAPHKQALAGIARAPDGGPSEWLHVLAAALDSQGWALAAAGLEAPGLKGDLHKLGLVRIHARTLRVWLDDDDAGLSRTMAALDRSLRDGEAMMRRIETPIALCSSFIRAFRDVRAGQTDSKEESKPTDDTHHEPAS
jgi:ubiquinone biosynthesis protein COQ9